MRRAKPRAATQANALRVPMRAAHVRAEPRRLEMPRFSVSQAPAARREPSVWTAIESPRDLRLLEAIADAVKGLDDVEVVVCLLELLAQPLDVAVDGAVVDVDLVVVGGIHQRVARLDHARTCGERLQDE